MILLRNKKLKKKLKFTVKAKIIFVYALIFVIGFSILAGRLIDIQIVDHSYYLSKENNEQIKENTIPAMRGTIYDRNLEPLAESARVFDVVASPSYIKNNAQRGLIADNLSKILGIDRNTLYKEINNKSNYVVIKKLVEKPAADKINAFLQKNHIGCVALEANSKRYYPFGNFASQLLGFTGSNGQGLYGVEAYYNSVLCGVPGKSTQAMTATGDEMPYKLGTDIAPKNGSNLVLTIDEQVQQDLENNLKNALAANNVSKRVTGIVMDVKTGEIIAMATEPGFDPNSPYAVADSSAKKQLAALRGSALKTATEKAFETQWRNKAVSEPYEPGSTFKIITASAALEEGTVTENTMFNDPGYINILGTRINNWMRNGQGNVNFLQGFEFSNDTVFIKTGEMLGAKNFFNYYADFGLTKKTGIDLPGEADSIYYSESELGPVQLASEAFGQSDKITAVQLITAVAASANGGYLVQPHVVKEETSPDGNVVKTFGTSVKRQVISSNTSKQIDTMLYDEVSIGTGKNAYVAGYRIGGKTGTSQKLDDQKDHSAVVSSMICVAPTDDPQYAVLVVMDEPHVADNFGGVIAAPVVGSIMSEILPYLGVEPKYTSAELASMDIKTPNALGMTVAAAKNLLGTQGLSANVVGNGQTVTTQYPAAGNQIPKSGTVTLNTGGSSAATSVTVPNVVGMTPKQAQSTLKSSGLNPDLVGTGLDDSGVTAFEQDHAAGSKVLPGTVVSVKFRNNNLNVN